MISLERKIILDYDIINKINSLLLEEENPMLLSREQLQQAFQQANLDVRLKAKKAGASIYYMKNNKRLREDANGQKYEIIYTESGERKEYEYHE